MKLKTAIEFRATRRADGERLCRQNLWPEGPREEATPGVDATLHRPPSKADKWWWVPGSRWVLEEAVRGPWLPGSRTTGGRPKAGGPDVNGCDIQSHNVAIQPQPGEKPREPMDKQGNAMKGRLGRVSSSRFTRKGRPGNRRETIPFPSPQDDTFSLSARLPTDVCRVRDWAGRASARSREPVVPAAMGRRNWRAWG